MKASALHEWRSDRLPRLDRLLAAHPHTTGSITDPAVADEWTRALVLLLAAEFQGFCRDLHNDAAAALARGVDGRGGRLADMIVIGLTMKRGLDRRAANVQTLGEDFRRLGTGLWPALTERYPTADAWMNGLIYLHKARSGVIHADDGSVVAARDAGWPLELPTIRRWRNLVDEVVEAMEYLVVTNVAELVDDVPIESGGSHGS